MLTCSLCIVGLVGASLSTERHIILVLGQILLTVAGQVYRVWQKNNTVGRVKNFNEVVPSVNVNKWDKIMQLTFQKV